MIYIYSMQSFVFSEMNKASRMKDESKIKFYGAFASALGFIVHCGNKRVAELKKVFTVYRGLQMSQEELDHQFKLGDTVNLLGFTSTSLSMESALKFAIKDMNLSFGAQNVAILLGITIRGANQFFYLNSAEYFSFP